MIDVSTNAPLHIGDNLFDLSDGRSLGLGSIPGQHTQVYRATQKLKYAHHPHICVFKDCMYAMWSVGLEFEDSPSQHVLYAHSCDGVNWSDPTVIGGHPNAPDAPDSPLWQTAGGWWIHGETLVAYFTTSDAKATPGKAPKWGDLLRLDARTSTDGLTWNEAFSVMDQFMVNEAPRALPSGRLLMTGQDFKKKRIRLLYTDDPRGISGWRDGQLPALSDENGPLTRLCEPTWYHQADGQVVVVIRDDSKPLRYRAITTRDGGAVWAGLTLTNFPDSCSKPSAGNLPNGAVYLINNPNPDLTRNPSQISPTRIPLTLAISDDGITFDRAFIIRNEPTKMRYKKPGEPGYAYPSTVVWNDHLYIIYSINKEDIDIACITLSDLG